MRAPRPKLFSHQNDLPRLPVMDLEETCKRYLYSIKPLASEAEYAATERAVKDFLKEGGEGRELQQLLLQHSDAEWAQGRNWLENWWLQFAYLMWPDPLPLNSNVFFYFCTLPQGEHIFQAARLLSTFLQAKVMVDKEELPVEFTGSLPMDMSQHKRAFTTARIPGPKGDELRVLEPGNHVVVLCNHRLFQIPAVDSSGSRICSQVFERLLRHVWAEAHGRMPRVQHSVALLTSEKRPVWAQWRRELEKDNRAVLEAIDRALLVLVLEDEEPSSHDEALRLIAGGDANNRWFDKGVQVIVFRNGLSGMNAEHSPAEATMHDAVFGGPVFQRMRELGPWAYPDALVEPSGPLPVHELVFTKPAGIGEALHSAQVRWDADFADIEVRALQFREWGADWAKEAGLPIDSVIQMALQLAWGRMHGAPVACYETSHLRIFKGARTETCRSTSAESKAWVDSVVGGQPVATQKKLLRQACEAQKNYMMDCIKGKGCDRHLLGLRIIAMQKGGNMPAIFTDPMYAKSTKWRLSTSTVRTTEVGGFPPVTPDGYGICYMFWRSGTTIVAAVSARRSCTETSAEQFKDAICTALHDIRAIWESPEAKI